MPPHVCFEFLLQHRGTGSPSSANLLTLGYPRGVLAAERGQPTPAPAGDSSPLPSGPTAAAAKRRAASAYQHACHEIKVAIRHTLHLLGPTLLPALILHILIFFQIDGEFLYLLVFWEGGKPCFQNYELFINQAL